MLIVGLRRAFLAQKFNHVDLGHRSLTLLRNHAERIPALRCYIV